MNHTIIPRRQFFRTFALFSGGWCFAGQGRRSLFVASVQAQSSTLIGIFRVNLDTFPALKNEFGSLRLAVTGMPTSFRDVIVTRIAGNQFHAVSSRCTHQGTAVDPYNNSIKALRCPNHGSRFGTDGKVLVGPATTPLDRYNATFDGDKTVAIEIPGLGYSATVARATSPAMPEGRVRLEFPTVTGLKYEIRFRPSLADAEWTLVPFATVVDGPLTQTRLTGTNTRASVFVAPSSEYGFLAVTRFR